MMKRRSLLVFVPVSVLLVVLLLGAATGRGARPALAELNVDQAGFLPVVFDNYAAGAAPTPVTPVPVPVIEIFTATPDEIKEGNSSTLRWTVTGQVDSVTILPDVGTVGKKGKTTVSPAQTTEYTITAVNPGGNVTAKVTVSVIPHVPPPQISSFTATPAEIELGESSTLAWTVDGTIDSLKVTPGNINVTGQTSLGVSPTETTTYTLTAVNESGEATATTDVTVIVPAPQISTFTATPPSIAEGGSSTLAWTVSGPVDSLTISPGNLNVTGQNNTSVSPTQTTTYTLTAVNAGGQVTAQATVTVLPAAPLIDTFMATPAVIEQLGQATLSWQTSGQIDSLSISPGVGDVTGETSAVVSPLQTTQYTLTAVNGGGQATKKTTVTVTAAPGVPEIVEFVAWPEKPIDGQPTLLRWQTIGALNSLILRANDGSEDRNVVNQTQIELTPGSGVTTYRLTAKNDDGEAEATVQVEVVTQADVPPVLAYDWNGPVTQAVKGFPRFQPPSANGNWRTPYNYAGGRLYYRAEVFSQPVAQDMRLQYCVWQELNGESLALENCGSTKAVSGTPGTVVTWNSSVEGMWKLGGTPLQWERPRFRDAFAIKNSSNCPVSNFNIDASLAPGCPVRDDDPTLLALWANEDPAAWYPLNIRLSVYVVAEGDTFPGWDGLP